MDWNLENYRARVGDTGLLLLVLEWVTIGLLMLMIVLSVLQIELLPNAASEYFTRSELRSQAAIVQRYQTLASLMFVAALFASSVTFFIWVYRSNVLARALGATAMEYTPGWSVGWFFIPVANLIKPYFIVKELYLATCSPRDYDLTQDAPSGLKTVQLWWFVVLVDKLFAAVTMIWSAQLVISGHFTTAAAVSTASGCLSLLAGLMTVALVLELRHQQEHASTVRLLTAIAPA